MSVLTGLRFVEVSCGPAGAIATMLAADYGAEVVKVEPPGGDPYRRFSPFEVWDRGKRSVELDIRTSAGRNGLLRLAAGADVVVESFAPREADALRLEDSSFRLANERLVHCSITGWGRATSLADRPGIDALVQTRAGAQFEQLGLRDGPIFLHMPMPSFGAAITASLAINAALYERELSGLGQWVQTSLFQGLQAFALLNRIRVEHPPEDFFNLYACPKTVATPPYAAADRWIHPMPEVAPFAARHLGLPDDTVPGRSYGPCEGSIPFQTTLQRLLEQRPAQEWVRYFADNDVRCQPVQSVEEAFVHAQVLANGVVTEVHTEQHGRVKQFAFPYRMSAHTTRLPLRRAPRAGEHSSEMLAETRNDPSPPQPARAPRRIVRRPLEGIRVLDFGLALAGPYGPSVLADLGADVLRVDNINLPRSPDDQTWAACQRGKRSIMVDLKTPDGQEIVQELVRGADVVHHNMRTGVAERLHIGYGQVAAVNPRIVYAHVTGFGTTGPLARSPGCDQMGQALVGIEYEQGATVNGGHPTWVRHGVCDHVTALLSAIATLQALYDRERTGLGQLVETDIVSAGTFLCTDAFLPVGSANAVRSHLDPSQTGFGPLYRLYETADGWICIAALFDEQWHALVDAVPQVAELRDDPDELSQTLEALFASRAASEWFQVLDRHGVPVEIADPDFFAHQLADASFRDAGTVGVLEHPRFGRIEHHGPFFSFSRTPVALERPPVTPGWHSREVLREVGFDDIRISDLAARNIIRITQG